MQKLKRKSLSEQALDSIVDYIRSHNLSEGDKLPTESEFCEMLKISRTGVREAIKALSINGALESIPGKGTYIRSDVFVLLDRTMESTGAVIAARASIREIMEIRTALETMAFDLALERGTEEELELVQEAMDSLLDDVQEGRSWVVSGTLFHTRIAEMSHNGFLVEIVSSLATTIGQYKHALFKAKTMMDPYLTEHMNILDALKSGDKKAGHKAIRTHNEITERDISELINADTASTFLDIGKVKY